MITNILLVLTIAISVISFNKPALLERLKHFPYLEERKKEFYRLLTSGFVHGGVLHLVINMYVLWEFGRVIEFEMIKIFGDPIGMIFYLGIYLLTIVMANLPSYANHKNDAYFASVGASGAIAGLLFIYAFLHPWYKLLLYGIIPIYAVIGGVLYLVYSSWASKNKQDHIDHSAHFYGAIFGLIFLVFLKPSLISRFFDDLIHNFPF